MKKVLMVACSLIPLATACAPQAPVVSLPGADVAAVRLNSASALDLDEANRSLKINVSLDATAPPSFGIRTITQPTDYLVTHVTTITLQLRRCSTAVGAQALNPETDCGTVVTTLDKAVSLTSGANSTTFTLSKLDASKFYTVKAIPKNSGGTSIASTATTGEGYPAILPPGNTSREYISTSSNGTITLNNDAGMTTGNSSSVTYSATANTQIDIRLKLQNSTGGSVSGNTVAVEDGTVSSTGEVIS